MNSPQTIYDNADVQLIMAARSELPSFSKARAELAGQEFFAPGFLSTLFAAERQAAHEAEELRAIESSMFPRALPQVDTLAYAGVSMGARHVGGDFYDFFPRGERRIGMVIGDISGKGIPAALLRANLQATVRTVFSLENDMERALCLVNQLFYQSTPEGSYATLLYLEYDEDTRILRYVNCGHPAPILLSRDGSVARLEATCTVLGLFEDWDCSTAEMHLDAADTLLLYTDGIVEAFNLAGDEFGEDRLIDLLRRSSPATVSGLLQRILAAVERFTAGRRHDDMTLVGLHCGNFEVQ